MNEDGACHPKRLHTLVYCIPPNHPKVFLILINALTTVQSEGIKDDGGSLE